MKAIIRKSLGFVVLVGISLSSLAFAQESSKIKGETTTVEKYRVLYDKKMIIQANQREINEKYRLSIGKELNKFYSYDNFYVDSLSQAYEAAGQNPEDAVAENAHLIRSSDILYTLPSDNLFLTEEFIPVYVYYFTEPMQPIEWQMSEDTATICGYSCKKAEADYLGRHWEVYYTEDLPFPYGPWKLYGLPGLITKAASSDGLYTFTMLSFSKSPSPEASFAVVPIIPEARKKGLDYKELDKATFRKYKRLFFVDPRKLMQVTTPGAKLMVSDDSAYQERVRRVSEIYQTIEP